MSHVFTYCVGRPGGVSIPSGSVIAPRGIELGGSGTRDTSYEITDNNIVVDRGVSSPSGSFMLVVPLLTPGPHHFQVREHASAPFTSEWRLTVQGALNPPQIDEAEANNGVLDVAALGSKDANLRALTWAGIDAGQQVWLTLTGQKTDGSPHSLVFWSGGNHKVNATWVSDGYWVKPLTNAFLAALGNGSALRLSFKVSMDKSGEESTATLFPDRVYTIKTTEAALSLEFLGSPYGVVSKGRIKDIELRASRDGQPVAGVSVVFTAPAGVNHPDGGSGSRSFVTDQNGIVTVANLRAIGVPGRYVLKAAMDQVEVAADLQVRAESHLGDIPVGNGPNAGIGFSPDGSRAYVVNRLSGSMSIIDTNRQVVINSVTVGVEAWPLAVSPDGRTVFVGHQENGTVLVISTITNTIERVVTIGSRVSGIDIKPDGSHLFVCSVDHTVSIIDLSDFRILHTILVEKGPITIRFNRNGDRAYVVCNVANVLQTLDTERMLIEHTLPTEHTPLGLAIHPEGHLAYITSLYKSAVVDLIEQKTISTFHTGHRSAGVVVSRDGTRLYIATNEKIEILDARSLVLESSFPSGNGPYWLALNSEGNRLYATCPLKNLVSAYTV